MKIRIFSILSLLALALYSNSFSEGYTNKLSPIKAQTEVADTLYDDNLPKSFLYLKSGLIDSSAVELRNDPTLYSGLMNSGQFDYKDSKPKNDFSAFFYEKVYKFIINYIVGPLVSTGLGNLILIVIMLAVVIIVVYRIISGNFTNLLFNSSAKTMASVDLNQDIQLVDFETLIASAVAEKRYKDAVRYLYLNALKSLAETNIIAWKQDKTNFDYYLEIKDSNIKSRFQKISTVFNYIEYGDYEVNSALYEKTREKFDSFNRALAGSL